MINSTDRRDKNIGAQGLDSKLKFRHIVDHRRRTSMAVVYLTRCNKRVVRVLEAGESQRVPPCRTCMPDGKPGRK